MGVSACCYSIEKFKRTGDLPAMMPLLQEFVSYRKECRSDSSYVWAGSNGCVPGSLSIQRQITNHLLNFQQ